MIIHVKIPFLTSLYILCVIYNIYLMRKLLIVDEERIESFIDVVFTIVLIICPIIGTWIIADAINETLSLEEKKLKRIKIKKIIKKIFFIK